MTSQPYDLNTARIASLSKLWMSIWPQDGASLEDYIARYHRRTQERPDRRLHSVFEGDDAIAVAESFSRVVHSPEGSFFVMALAGVCSDPSRRGEGFGAAVARSAFERVDQREFSVSLFQSPVPAFYERLGAREIDNSFRNEGNTENPEANPFWEPHIMIYPGTAHWPQGSIDLNGPGY